ncbi:phage tail protein [Shinella daejeonensis]|uniref:phage tail tube protein n=1 Tax=Shinella daejeonensis TaxID=659017 RepID=UPI0020C7AF61|nr:phage tail tube protein [Shinella daejeonensis]MCP8894298.1 phage tail protein [Shinella daejeonensis]
MAKPKTLRGGKVRVLLGDDATPIEYTAPCGFTSKSITLTKGLEEVQIPDCDNPDAVDWLGRDAVSLSMGINGEGLMAQESVETWLDAWESVESVPAKVEWEFPAKTITWTGFMHVETVQADAPNGRRVTSNISMQSDGEMVRTVTPEAGG